MLKVEVHRRFIEADMKGIHKFMRDFEAGKDGGDKVNKRANAKLCADGPGSSRQIQIEGEAILMGTHTHTKRERERSKNPRKKLYLERWG
jgi:hypothetical protein